MVDLKKILNFSPKWLVKKFSIVSSCIKDLLIKDNFIRFAFNKVAALFSFSMKVTFFALRESDSIPKDPIPEYKSRIFEFSIFVFIRFECLIILKMFSLTESFKGLVWCSLKN